MREIKFRAWNSFSGQSSMWGWDKMTSHNDIEPGWLRNSLGGEYEDCYIMQFTGLKDKNGVEIYEGDVVVKDDYPFYSDGELNYVGVVEWHYGAWNYGLEVVSHRVAGRAIGDMMDGDGRNGADFRVIGNIYENPELLERL